MKDEDLSFNCLPNNIGMLGWLKRRQEGIKNEMGFLSVGDAKILFTPGKLFVKYQLAAKKRTIPFPCDNPPSSGCRKAVAPGEKHGNGKFFLKYSIELFR